MDDTHLYVVIYNACAVSFASQLEAEKKAEMLAKSGILCVVARRLFTYEPKFEKIESPPF